MVWDSVALPKDQRNRILQKQIKKVKSKSKHSRIFLNFIVVLLAHIVNFRAIQLRTMDGQWRKLILERLEERNKFEISTFSDIVQYSMFRSTAFERKD
jgi:hypothetical protein